MLTYKYNQQSQPLEHDPLKSRPCSLMAAGVDQEDVDELVHSVFFFSERVLDGVPDRTAGNRRCFLLFIKPISFYLDN